MGSKSHFEALSASADDKANVLAGISKVELADDVLIKLDEVLFLNELESIKKS